MAITQSPRTTTVPNGTVIGKATGRPGIEGNGTMAFGSNGLTNEKGGANLTSEQLIRSVSEMASTSARRSNRLFDAGFSGLDDVMGYLQKIVGGDRESMFSAVAPQVGAVTDQYDTAYKNVVERGPRGGGRTSAAIGLKTAEAGDIGRLIANARPQALAQLQELISNLFGQSSGLEQLAMAGSQTALSGRVGKDQMNAQQWQSLGQSLGMMIAMGATNGKGLTSMFSKAPE